MLNMIVRKGRNKEVAVIIIGLHPQLDALINTSFFCSGHEILWKQLTLLVEIVSGTLPPH